MGGEVPQCPMLGGGSDAFICFCPDLCCVVVYLLSSSGAGLLWHSCGHPLSKRIGGDKCSTENYTLFFMSFF